MSRLGKKPIEVPGNVKVTIGSDNVVTVEGPKGTLKQSIRPEISVTWDEGEKIVNVGLANAEDASRQSRAHWGTSRSLISNMVKGVVDGYEKKLEIVGVGWGATVTGTKVQLKVGFANLIFVDIPMGVSVQVEKQIVTITGADKQAVGELAAKIRAKKKPEPYNGKGIKYIDEVIRRKASKAFGK